ncbi:MAG TPA: hypothetical protein VGH24_01345 [Solirubrobacteraceae bacterium]
MQPGRRIFRRAWLATLCAGAVGAVALAGCGSSTSTNSSSNQVVRAAYLSTNSSGYQMRFALQLGSAALPQPVTGVGSGTFSVPSHSGALVLNLNLGSSPQITQVLGSSTFRIEEIIKGTTVYVKLPDAITSKVPSLSAKPWVKVDLAKVASGAGIPGISSLVNNPSSSDPSQFLQYLRAAGGTVTKEGTAVVNGFQTTKYHATISLDKVPDAVPAASRASAKSAIAAIEKTTNLHTIPVDVWIDGNNLVRRMHITLGETVNGQSINTGITVDIVKYGPQPQPPAPPPGQVSDLGSLTGSGSSTSSSSSGSYFPGG